MSEINNIILFDTEKEYSKSEIESNETLNILKNRIIGFGGFSTLIDLINDEDATLYITSDLAHIKGSGKLINASSKLLNEYALRKP